MIPRARIVHATPGRVRLKIGSMRGDRGYFDGLLSMLAGIEGVRLLQVNPRTGSVLVGFEPGALESFAEQALQRKVFVLDQTFDPDPQEKGAGTPIPGMWVGDAVFDWRMLAAVALIGFAIRQMADGKVLSPAVTLLWYAFELLERVGRKQV
ncbi:MAG: HMA2 domain-containing protein [Pseudomonadota bacterium]